MNTTVRIAITKATDNTGRLLIVISDGVKHDVLAIQDRQDVLAAIDEALAGASTYRTEGLFPADERTLACYGRRLAA